MGQFKPCQPSKVLFTAFVPRKSLENDGNKGDLLPSGGRQSHACDGGWGWAGSTALQALSAWPALFQGSVFEVVVFCALCCLTLKLPLLKDG